MIAMTVLAVVITITKLREFTFRNLHNMHIQVLSDLLPLNPEPRSWGGLEGFRPHSGSKASYRETDMLSSVG